MTGCIRKCIYYALRKRRAAKSDNMDTAVEMDIRGDAAPVEPPLDDEEPEGCDPD